MRDFQYNADSMRGGNLQNLHDRPPAAVVENNVLHKFGVGVVLVGVVLVARCVVVAVATLPLGLLRVGLVLLGDDDLLEIVLRTQKPAELAVAPGKAGLLCAVQADARVVLLH
eukprot:2521790-Pleurochrysis_carterae.AAC.1